MSESVFLSPKSIAVIGASDKEGSVGRAITSNIMKGYKGIVYPISPTRETVFDQKAYKSVMDVPESIDLAVVITKNTIVPIVLEECGKKGIKGAIVITAGFKEVDEEGKKLEQKLKDIKKKLEKFQKQVLAKFDDYVMGIALMPPPKPKEGEKVDPNKIIKHNTLRSHCKTYKIIKPCMFCWIKYFT